MAASPPGRWHKSNGSRCTSPQNRLHPPAPRERAEKQQTDKGVITCSLKLISATSGRWNALHTGVPSITILLRDSARTMPRCPRSARMCLFAWIGAMRWACHTGRKTPPLHGPRIGGPQKRSILMLRWPREGSPAAGPQADCLPGAIAIARDRL